MNIVHLFALLAVMCGVYQVKAGGYQPEVIEIEVLPEVDPVEVVEVVEVPLARPYPIRYGPRGSGWDLSNSEVLTGGSAKGLKNVLAGGSTSADGASFSNSKTNSRTRQNSEVQLGMIGGDGGDNYNSQSSGIGHNGGGIVNFLSKVQGVNNQGINSAQDLWGLIQRVYNKAPAVVVDAGYAGYAPVEGSYAAPLDR